MKKGRFTDFLIMRHGQTVADVRTPRVFAPADDHLAKRGRQDARRAADWFADGKDHCLQRIISSSLPRALDTANIIAERLGMAVTVVPDLRERENGELAGLTKEQAEAKGFLRDYAPHETVPGGETLTAFRARAEASWSKLLDECKDGERIMVVSHGQMIGMLFRWLLGLPVDDSVGLKTGDTGIHCWRVAGDKRTVVFSNSRAHLPTHGEANRSHDQG